jgi:hypothetical protein
MFLGIDPGVSGGLALLNQHGFQRAFKMPGNLDRAWGVFQEIASYPHVTAVIEQVGGYIGGGGHPGSKMFNFGANYGMLLMGLRAVNIPTQRVVPRVWQKALALSKPRL